jgi:hypothetical protein
LAPRRFDPAGVVPGKIHVGFEYYPHTDAAHSAIGTIHGLRGGKFTETATDAGYDFTLRNLQWTEDVAVSGTVSWNQTSNIIIAQVSLKSGGAQVGNLKIRWNDADINAIAAVSGKIQGAALSAQRIAP